MARSSAIRQEIFQGLLSGLDLALEWAENPREFHRQHFGGHLSSDEWANICHTRRQREALKRLQNAEWLKVKKEGNAIIFRLEKDALCIAVQDRIRKTDAELPKGTVCLVAFDFPVGANDARTFWRRFLRSAGFAQKQLSVWVSEKDVVADVRLLVELLDVSRRVSVYRAQEV